MTQRTIYLKPDLQELEKIFSWLDEQMLPVFVSPQVLALLCEEIFCNIVTHSYHNFSDPQSRQIELTFEFNVTELKLRFTDFGMPMQGSIPKGNVSSLSLEERPIGGVGWALIHHYAKEANYITFDGRNELTIILRDKGENHGSNNQTGK